MFSSTLKEPKGPPVLGHVGDSHTGDLVGRHRVDTLLLEKDFPRSGGHETHDGLERRALARAVAPDEADDFACAHLEIHAVENVGAPVMNV